MDGRRAREDRDCGRAGDRVAAIGRDIGKRAGVTFDGADADLEARIDEAHRQKYRRYAKNIVDSTLTPRARSAVLKLLPKA